MKKLMMILSALVLMCMAPIQMSAQNENQKSEKNSRRQFDPATMAQQRAKQMAEKYSLTEEQQTKLTTLFTEQMKNFQGGQRGRGRNGQRQNFTKEQRDSMQTAMKAQREKFQNSLKEILTEDQYNQFVKDQEARMKQMRERRGNGPRERNNRQNNEE